jgi:hypothetical protein
VKISLVKVCGLLWNCTDIVPSMMFDQLSEDLELDRRTYAAGARAIHRWISDNHAAA